MKWWVGPHSPGWVYSSRRSECGARRWRRLAAGTPPTWPNICPEGAACAPGSVAVSPSTAASCPNSLSNQLHSSNQINSDSPLLSRERIARIQCELMEQPWWGSPPWTSQDKGGRLDAQDW